MISKDILNAKRGVVSKHKKRILNELCRRLYRWPNVADSTRTLFLLLQSLQRKRVGLYGKTRTMACLNREEGGKEGRRSAITKLAHAHCGKKGGMKTKGGGRAVVALRTSSSPPRDPIISKLGGAGSRSGDYLCVNCANFQFITRNSPGLSPKVRSLTIRLRMALPAVSEGT